MIIDDVHTYVLRYEVDESYGGSSKGRITERSALLVQVITDEGISGWGEAGQTGLPELPQLVIEHLYRPLLIGQDPFDVELHWERMYEATRDFGQKGIAIEAISGVDVALWDVLGKATGLPAHKLLGGRFRDRIMAYPCGLYYRPAADLTKVLVDEALGYVDQGFKAIKMKIGGLTPRDDIHLIEAVRAAVGDDITLMADANHAYNAYTAIKMGRVLEANGFLWFEEPVVPENVDSYIEVKEALDIAISGGECEFTRYGFKDLISRRAVDIVQPDTCTAGGLTECRKIAAMASAWGIQYVPHVWGSAVGLAAAIQLLASLPHCPPCRQPVPLYQSPVLEFDRNPNPLRDELITQPFQHEDGYVPIPDGPGLGIEINEEILARYLVKS